MTDKQQGRTYPSKVKEAAHMTEEPGEQFYFICEQFGKMVTVSGPATQAKDVVNMMAQFMVACGFHPHTVHEYLETDAV